ncbi:MAG: Rdx family protein [Anaerolineales bacterium]|nr:Rdx family protein [Anaerolineales bacterium]
MAELVKNFEERFQSIKLIPSDGGCFEVMVGDQLVYSKLQTGNHIEPGDLVKLVGKAL